MYMNTSKMEVSTIGHLEQLAPSRAFILTNSAILHK
jgi:hypothetical protein